MLAHVIPRLYILGPCPGAWESRMRPHISNIPLSHTSSSYQLLSRV